MVVVGEIGEMTQKLPEDQRQELVEIGISEDIARVVVDRGQYQSIADMAENDKDLAVEAAKFLLITPEFGDLSTDSKTRLIAAKIDNGWGNVFVQQMIQNTDRSDGQIEKEISLRSASSHDISAVVSEAIAENPKIVSDFRGGNANALNALVGQVMAKTKGAANVGQARSELEKQLS
jgi:Asp-tRNA(Asn)/Glu-tRNA(Gln) amidotransferase B subunit